MILWVDGAHDPRENMRRDERLLAAAEGGALAGPVLRLFTFAPAGITLGRAQDPARVLDLERCARDRVPWAVRPTGGRAIPPHPGGAHPLPPPPPPPPAPRSIAPRSAPRPNPILASPQRPRR